MTTMSTPTKTMLESILSQYRERIEQVLDQVLTLPESGSSRLREAMRYAALGGGKRLRPTLVYTSGLALGASLDHPGWYRAALTSLVVGALLVFLGLVMGVAAVFTSVALPSLLQHVF